MCGHHQSTKQAQSSRSTIAVFCLPLHIFCPQTISNKDMLIQCKLECINFVSSSCRGWQWISHVFRRERDSFWRRHLTGHKRVGTSGAGQKIHGNALFWQRWGVWATTGAPSKSWSGSESCGSPLLLPCVPVGTTASEWLSLWMNLSLYEI